MASLSSAVRSSLGLPHGAQITSTGVRLWRSTARTGIPPRSRRRSAAAVGAPLRLAGDQNHDAPRIEQRAQIQAQRAAAAAVGAHMPTQPAAAAD